MAQKTMSGSFRPSLAEDWGTQMYINGSILSFAMALLFVFIGVQMAKSAQTSTKMHKRAR